MLDSIRNFWNHQVVGSRSDRDYGSRDGLPTGVKLGAAGAVTAAATGIGYAVGAAREARDVVTVEQVPYAETVQVPVGSHVQHGCYQYHYGYDALNGEFGYHYGYDASCTQTVTDYETRATGRTLYREVTHHTEGFPHTALQGALVGFGVGLATSVAGLVIAKVLENR